MSINPNEPQPVGGVSINSTSTGVWGFVAVLALAIGGAVGYGLASGGSSTDASVCLEFIDASEKALDYSVEALGYASDGMMAGANFDIQAIERSTDKLYTLSDEIDAHAPTFQSTRDECRAAVGE